MLLNTRSFRRVGVVHFKGHELHLERFDMSVEWGCDHALRPATSKDSDTQALQN